MTRRLTPKQRRFVDEYLIDLNATQAAIRAGYSARTARQMGDENLSKPDIAREIQNAMKARAERTEITQDRVLERWWAIATADPNDLVQLRRCCCRYCHGKDFEYQWVDEQEFAQALTIATLARGAKKKRETIVLPTDKGGYGYVRSNEANPVCPKCDGEGLPEVYAHDTRQLTGAARLLYAGTKLTPAGFEIKMKDQMSALDKVARHLGMYKDSPDKGPDPDEFVRRLESARRRVIDPE